MTFVADENGFQPQSDALPVAPAFPHPIPQFVLDQIEFARLEDEAAARSAKSSVRTPNSYYAEPESSEEGYRNKRDVPAYGYSAPRSLDSDESFEIIPILREESILEEDGTHNFEFESANGTPFYMTFVTDENGFQPQSDSLPVAPAFPHPIPQFVLDQIEFARLEDEA